MKLNQLLDLKVLDFHRLNGFVGCQRHPTLPLRIYNYTPRAAFANAWGDGVIDYCRGLIVDDEDNIVARPFKKFHNLNTSSISETWEKNLPVSIPDITVKMDGSLGIWHPDGGARGAIATRGSFTSPQAIWATKHWKENTKDYASYLWEDSWTPLFEIIYPENRIVVDYGSREDLVVIGGIYIETGKEVERENLIRAFGSAVVKHFDVPNVFTTQQLSEHNYPNEEGYVLTYSNGLKIKVKFEDYKRLHRIITGVNPRSLWELLMNGQILDVTGLPANFIRWADKWAHYLQSEYTKIYDDAQGAWIDRPFREPDDDTRKYRARFAAYVARLQPHLKPLLFNLLDNKDISKIIWSQIEPAGNDNRFSTSGIDATPE